jgi:predicted RNase H-like HicB family nuclease
MPIVNSLPYNVGMDNEFTIVFEPAEDGAGFTAYIPEVPGAISEGDTVEEAREMVLDALRELTTYRREVAMRSTSSKSFVERVSLVF